MLKTFAAAATAVLIAGSAQAGLIQNGDFELGPAGSGLINNNSFDAMSGQSGNRSWDVWTALPGWTTASGSGIEVQTRRTIGGADPQSGDHYVELDSHPKTGGNSTMMQSVQLDAGTYRLSYWYQPRTNRANDNVLSVLFDGNEIARHDETSSSQTGWALHFADIDVNAAGTYGVAFAAGGLETTLGAFVDNVDLAPVPVPAALPLLATGLGGLALWRRRRG